jgi:hypothetical protein
MIVVKIKSKIKIKIKIQHTPVLGYIEQREPVSDYNNLVGWSANQPTNQASQTLRGYPKV